ncbi:MAG: rhodanese-like domain-containing protein [Candidatus Acidiferrales bacterium]
MNKYFSIRPTLALSLFAIAAFSPALPAARGPARNSDAQAAHHPSPAAAQATLKDAHLIEPEELAKKISGPREGIPVIFFVGYAVLYRGAHIPGAQNAGPGVTKEGIDQLKSLAYPLPLDREIVVYCGCCPFDKCPNILPAYRALLEMGFKRLEILNLPQSFAHDWVEKNLPVVRGRA